MRLRYVLLATCLTGAAGASVAADAVEAQQPAPPPVYAPVPGPPPPPLPPPRPLSPEVRAAFADARATEALIESERLDDAVANYRRSIAQPSAGDVAGVAFVRSIHLSVLAGALIRGGRSGDADRLLADYLAATPPAAIGDDARRRDRMRFTEYRIYIAAGRGDVPALLALLDGWDSLDGRHGPTACIAPPMMPVAVAPMHRNEAVRARLNRLGCDDDIVDQIDRLADDPIEPPYFLPAPGRREPGGTSAPETPAAPPSSGAEPVRRR